MSATNETVTAPASLCVACRGQLSPADTMLGAADLQHRYGSGRDKTYDLIHQAGFIRSILPGTGWVASLQALQTWELAHQLNGTLAALPLALPSAPPLARPGPRPLSSRMRTRLGWMMG